jgi:hypothetical protein
VKYRSILSVAWLALFVLPCSAQSSAFTYQGRLNFNNVPANGSYDFRFRLAADALGNTYIGGAVLSNALAVQGGLFNATLDFGAGVFTGSNYWLQIDVKTNGAGGYTTLNPLQAVTPTPYALFAAGASNVLGTVPGNKLSGTYGNVLNFSNAANSFNGTFTGNGAGLANVNALTLGGLAPGSFWQLTGNVVNAIDFFGSVNNQPVQLRVNNQRALRLEAAGGSVNLIGGWSNNFAAAGVTQGTIGGGGGESVATPPTFSPTASSIPTAPLPEAVAMSPETARMARRTPGAPRSAAEAPTRLRARSQPSLAGRRTPWGGPIRPLAAAYKT